MKTKEKPQRAVKKDEVERLPDGWQCVKLGEVAEIVSGLTLGRPARENYTRKVPYLRVANVKDGWLDLSNVYEIEASEDEIEKCRLRYGDILLTEGGDPDKLGRGTFWQEQIPECLHQNHIFRARLPSDRFCHDFVSLQFGSPYGKAYFFAHAKQTTGIATINRGVLNRFPLQFPPLTEQRRIATRLREQLAEVAQARAATTEKLAALDQLPAALLREAFGGRT
jgi:type I restriction enzyme S subunit